MIKGIVEGCRQSGCQLLGGETAEMPGFYQKGEYDLAGFAGENFLLSFNGSVGLVGWLAACGSAGVLVALLATVAGGGAVETHAGNAPHCTHITINHHHHQSPINHRTHLQTHTHTHYHTTQTNNPTVGSVKQDRVITGKTIKAGDVVLAMASSGVHSNGFSLVRKVLEVTGTKLTDRAPWDASRTVGEALLEPTVIYVKRVLALHEAVGLKGVVHITGGGMTENIPRVIPKGLGVEVEAGAWELPPLFKWVQEGGKISDAEMRRTFNCGVGLVAVVGPEQVAAAKAADPGLFEVGRVVEGAGVTYV